jgi:hypothetical protein
MVGCGIEIWIIRDTEFAEWEGDFNANETRQAECYGVG